MTRFQQITEDLRNAEQGLIRSRVQLPPLLINMKWLHETILGFITAIQKEKIPTPHCEKFIRQRLMEEYEADSDDEKIKRLENKYGCLVH